MCEQRVVPQKKRKPKCDETIGYGRNREMECSLSWVTPIDIGKTKKSSSNQTIIAFIAIDVAIGVVIVLLILEMYQL